MQRALNPQSGVRLSGGGSAPVTQPARVSRRQRECRGLASGRLRLNSRRVLSSLQWPNGTRLQPSKLAIGVRFPSGVLVTRRLRLEAMASRRKRDGSGPRGFTSGGLRLESLSRRYVGSEAQEAERRAPTSEGVGWPPAAFGSTPTGPATPGSANGRPRESESRYGGSNPSPGIKQDTRG